MKVDDLKPGVRVQLTGRFATLYPAIAGEHGTVQDPPVILEGYRSGHVRVQLDRERDAGFGAEGIMIVDPDALQLEGAPPDGSLSSGDAMPLLDGLTDAERLEADLLDGDDYER